MFKMHDQFDSLYRHLLVEQDVNFTSVGIFPGAFKPPHVGHYMTALNACENNDKVYIFISKKPRALTTQNIAQPAGSKDCDADRYSNFMKNDKYTSNLYSIQPAACARMTSASALRTAISVKDKNTVFKNLPDGVDKDYIFDVLMMSNDTNNPDYGHITIDQTINIWNRYRQLLMRHTRKQEKDILIKVSDISPVKDTYDLVSDINNSSDAGKTAIKLYVGS